MGRGSSGASSGGAGGSGGAPLTKGRPETVSTYYRRGTFGGFYNDEALDAKFDARTGELSFSSAKDKDWANDPKTNKTKHVDITVENGAINGKTVNVNLNSDKIKSISAPNNSKIADTIKKNYGDKFGYNPSSKKYERGYKGYTSNGKTLSIQNALPSNLSSFSVIKGNTYDHRAAIKKAGFKWDGRTKTWRK